MIFNYWNTSSLHNTLNSDIQIHSAYNTHAVTLNNPLEIRELHLFELDT